MLLLSLSRLNTYTSHLKIMTFSKELLTRNMIIFGIEITTINSHFKNVYSHQVHWCVLSVFKWFSSIQLLSCVRLFATPWTAACQASLSITNSCSLLKLMSIKSVISSNHLILCCPLLLLPSIFPSIRVFSKKSVLCIRWPKYWSFSFSISPSNEYSGLISFRIDWLDVLAVQGTLKSILQNHSSKASILLIRWPKYWNFNFSVRPSNEYSGLISFRMDCFDLLAVQGTLKSLLQHHSSNTSIIRRSAVLRFNSHIHTRLLEKP